MGKRPPTVAVLMTSRLPRENLPSTAIRAASAERMARADARKQFKKSTARSRPSGCASNARLIGWRRRNARVDARRAPRNRCASCAILLAASGLLAVGLDQLLSAKAGA